MAKNNISYVKSKKDELIKIIKTKFITNEGLLSRNYPVKSRTLFDNFDDIVPFFLYFKETDFLLKQINLIDKINGSLYSLCADNGVLITRNIDEWFGGLYAIWGKTKDKIVYKILQDSVNFVKNNLLNKELLAGAYYNGKAVNFYECWSAGLLEVFCEMRNDFPDMFIESQNILKNWLNNKYFRKYNLFPYRIFKSGFLNFLQKIILSYFSPIYSSSKVPVIYNIEGFKSINKIAKNTKNHLIFMLQNGYYSQLMKSNSTGAFTLLEFYLATKDDYWSDNLIKWIDSAINSFYDNGKVYMEYIPKIKKRLKPMASPAFILVDVICDALYFVKDKFSQIQKNKLLNIAKNIIDYHWDNRMDNGLIPFHDKGVYAHIDVQVDFSVSIRKYAEISKNIKYLEKSKFLIEKTIEEHYSKDGYYTYSGDISKNAIDPKYNALLLKGFINILTLHESLYNKYYSLFKDR